MKKSIDIQTHAPVKSSVGMNEALGQSEVFLEFQERLSRVAPVNRPVLLLQLLGKIREKTMENPFLGVSESFSISRSSLFLSGPPMPASLFY